MGRTAVPASLGVRILSPTLAWDPAAPAPPVPLLVTTGLMGCSPGALTSRPRCGLSASEGMNKASPQLGGISGPPPPRQVWGAVLASLHPPGPSLHVTALFWTEPFYGLISPPSTQRRPAPWHVRPLRAHSSQWHLALSSPGVPEIQQPGFQKQMGGHRVLV